MRPIDAERLKRIASAFCTGAYNELPHIAHVVDLIDNAPTIDAVPVVRCKDCKFSHFIKSCSKYECEKCSGFLRYSNDFCSYGERKDEVSE